MPKRFLVISVAVVGALLAACGGTPTTSSRPGTSLAPLPSIAVPSLEIPNFSVPPIGVPSFAPDADLEALFPATVGGHPLEVTSAKGQDVVAAFGGNNPEEIQNFVSGLGASMDQVSAAFSFGLFPGASAGDFTGISLIAIRIQGVPGASTLAGLTEVSKEDVEDAQVGSATIGGKQVTAITSPSKPDENAYLYAVGDVVFLGGGTPALVEEAFAQLP